MIRPVLKEAGPSDNILSRLFMNSSIHISLNHVCNAVDRTVDTTVRFKFAKAVRLCAALAVHVRHPLHYFDQRRVDIIDQVYRVHDKLHIYHLCGIFYFPWHIH